MSSHDVHWDEGFLASQKARLVKLRDELKGELAAAGEDAQDQTQINGEARDLEDDAQKLAALELDGLLEKRQMTRLEAVERALQKIENGSYGISVVSGKKIPRARLEAVPEALGDVDEQDSLAARRNA